MTAIAGCVLLVAIGTYGFIRHVTASAHSMAIPIFAFDPFGLYYPMLEYGYSVLRTAHLPLWNPYQMAGLPFLATFYSAMLYPLNFPYLLLPVHTAMLVVTISHVILAGIGAALYARIALRVSTIAALAAGVVFMMNSYTLWAFTAQNQLYSLPWIPILFLAVDRIFTTSTLAWGAALGMGIALPILGGNLQTLSYEAYAVAPYVLACAYRRWREASPWAVGRACIVLAVGAAIGVALAAPQLLPTLELSNISMRSAHGLMPEQIEPAGSPPLPSVRLFLDGSRQPVSFLYAGVAVFLLVPFAFLSRVHRTRAIALVIAAVFTGLVAHGFSNPIGIAYVHLPMGNWFRALARAWGVTMFCVAALTAVGFDELFRERQSRRYRLLLGGAVVVLAVGLIAAAPARARWWIGCGAMVLLAVRAGELRGLWSTAARLALLGVLVIDFDSSVPINRTILPYTGDEYHALEVLRDAIQGAHAMQPATRSLHEGQLFNISTTPKLGMLFRVPTFDDDEPFVPARYRGWVIRAMGASSVRPSEMYLGGLGLSLQSPTFDPRFLDYAGVGSIVLLKYNPRHPPPSVAGLEPPTRVFVPPPRTLGARESLLSVGGSAYLFANRYAWPRAFVAGEVRTVAGPDEALEALSALPRGTTPLAIVEGEGSTDAAELGAGRGQATLVVSEPERVVVRANTEGPSVLVLLDTNLPGWVADVDGIETDILQTNYLFRGVRLPGGEHTVTFRYAPGSVRAGFVAGAAGVAAVLAIFATAIQRRARSITTRTSDA